MGGAAAALASASAAAAAAASNTKTADKTNLVTSLSRVRANGETRSNRRTLKENASYRAFFFVCHIISLGAKVLRNSEGARAKNGWQSPIRG